MHRLLFIGVGGTGGKAIHFTWREILRRLRANNWSGDGMPECFQFIHFDLPEDSSDYKDPDIPRSMYYNLADSPLEYRAYDADLTRNAELVAATAGWRPHPVESIKAPYRGAGQRRAVGRAVGVSRLDRIEDAIRQAALRLTTTEAGTASRQVDRLFSGDGALKGGQVFVVGSLAGGSGSGIFLDVIDRVRATSGQLDWFENAHFVAVTPDALLTLTPAERPGAEPNSLAAVSEYIAAFRWEGALQEHEAVLQASVGAVHGRDRRTGDHAYLIGNGNKAITFKSPTDVNRCIGKALAGYATTPAIQEFFEEVVINLRGANAADWIFFCDRGDERPQPFESFGFGTVSLGRDLFAEYSAQRLARATIDRLLTRDHGELSEREYIESKVDLLRKDFFDETGLHELDSEADLAVTPDGRNNQILDALRDRDETISQVKGLVSDVTNDLANLKMKFSSEQARAQFDQGFTGRQIRFEEEARARRGERARAWTAEVQVRLLEATARCASNNGLAVTIRLLELLNVQLQAAATQLEKDRSELEELERQSLRAVRAIYSEVKDKIIGISPVHGEAAKHRGKAVSWRLEQRVREDAVKIIRDARTGLVSPLIEALAAFESRLKLECDDKHGIGGVVDQWPTRDVPAELRPAPNEQLLVSWKKFPEELDSLLTETFKPTTPEERHVLAIEAQGRAIAEIIRGGWLNRHETKRTELGPQSLVGVKERWNPAVELVQSPEEAASRARFVAATDTLGLLSLAREWVTDRQGALSRNVNQTIAHYLSDAAADAAERGRRFSDALANAINCASPLVKVDERVRTAIYHEPSGTPKFILTPIPLSVDHPSYRDIADTLAEAGIPEERMFSTDETTREIDVFGFLSESVHPAVMSSVMGPIAAAWSSARTTVSERKSFWRLRRARSLEMFVPLPPSDQRALVRGWYVAALLGWTRGLDAAAGREPAPEIWTTSGWKAFPRPLLGDPVYRPEDILPALLESVPLIFLDIIHQQFDTTHAYGRLIELGAEGFPDLLDWLSRGESPKGAPAPSDLAGPGTGSTDGDLSDGDGDAEARRTAILAALDGWSSNYRAVLETTLDANRWSVDRRWEIAPLVLESLESLGTFLQSIDLGGSTVPSTRTRI